jgi:hypothetical protein
MSQPTDVGAAIAGWAAQAPKVRRVWIFERSTAHDPGARIDVGLELEPVPDGEESIATWMANAETWCSELGRQTGMTVELEWLDPDAQTQEARTLLETPKKLVFDRTHPDPGIADQ